MRSFKTRKECLESYQQFLDLYHSVCKPVAHNLYIVHKNSLIDQQTIYHILEHEQIPFRITPKSKFYKLFNLDSIDGDIFDVDEMFIDPEKSRKFFMRHLSSILQLNVECRPQHQGFFRGSTQIATLMILIILSFASLNKLFILNGFNPLDSCIKLPIIIKSDV